MSLCPSNAKGVVVWTCDNSADQNWNWNGTNKSFIRAGTNQCMDVQNPAPGKQVYTYQCDVNYNNANQKWEAIWLP